MDQNEKYLMRMRFERVPQKRATFRFAQKQIWNLAVERIYHDCGVSLSDLTAAEKKDPVWVLDFPGSKEECEKQQADIENMGRDLVISIRNKTRWLTRLAAKTHNSEISETPFEQFQHHLATVGIFTHLEVVPDER